MLSSISMFLSQVKLTLTQYLLLTAAVVIGVLLLVIRTKNRQLHDARVELLSKTFDIEQERADRRISSAKARYLAARKAARRVK